MKTTTKRKKQWKKRLAALVLTVCIGAAAFLCYQAWLELRERQAGEHYYETLADTLRTGEGKQTPAGGGSSGGEEEQPALDAEQPRVQDREEVRSQMDFAALWETCPDAVGWITIDGTVIDYPVVQGEDNSFYLKHLPDGQANAAGSIMMDVSCDGKFTDQVNILHGHHMRNKSMFGGLDSYKSEEYYRAHPVLQLYTPGGDHEVVIFAAFTVSGSSFGYPTGFAAEGEFEDFVRACRDQSAFRTEVEVQWGDRLLVLSTCAYNFTGARFIVVGKIME